MNEGRAGQATNVDGYINGGPGLLTAPNTVNMGIVVRGQKEINGSRKRKPSVTYTTTHSDLHDILLRLFCVNLCVFFFFFFSWWFGNEKE